MELRCNSCNVSITNQPGTTKFTCPKCIRTLIVRCPRCRKAATKYLCPECKFEGPN